MSCFRVQGPVAAGGRRPALWLPGSSGCSAQVAGLLGLPFAFAPHFSGHDTDAALALDRQAFRPSPVLARPYAMICAAVVAAETDAEARRLALPSALRYDLLVHALARGRATVMAMTARRLGGVGWARRWLDAYGSPHGH